MESDDYWLSHAADCVRKNEIDDIKTSSSIPEAITKLDSSVDLVLTASHVDTQLCIPLIRACRAISPVPKLVVMIGASSHKEIVDLILEGIDSYIDLPLDPERLSKCLDCLQPRESAFEKLCRAQVGRLGLIEAQRRLRQVMFKQALSQSTGNRSQTARLLGIDRRYVQTMATLMKKDNNGQPEN